MCVLLVEDDQTIATLVAETLRDEGFELVEAADGEVGLALFDLDPDRFRILITNVQLPGDIQGGEVAAIVRARRPDIPVVIASGAPEALEKRWHIEDGYIVLEKPYRLRELTDLVRRLVGRGDRTPAA